MSVNKIIGTYILKEHPEIESNLMRLRVKTEQRNIYLRRQVGVLSGEMRGFSGELLQNSQAVRINRR